MIRLHRAASADALVAALAGVLAVPLEDPFTAEQVAVHSRGIERWLGQELSARLGASAGRSDGVCANVTFPFPGRVIGGALAAASGIDVQRDPWRPERLAWPLLEVLDECLGQPWLGPLRAHLGAAADSVGPTNGMEHAGGADGIRGADATRRGRRYVAARHIADLFDRYGVHRPEMVRAWAAGADVDRAGRPLAPDARWQPTLWRHLRERLAVASPAERLADAGARIRDGEVALDLPARVSLFGLTALPASYVDVLSAIATRRDVHLFLLHPSPALWDRVAAAVAARPVRAVPRRDADATRELVRNPLLASWGRDAREMQVVVAAAGVDVAGDPLHAAEPAPPRTLLQRLQADIRADRPPAAPAPRGGPDPRPPLDPGDRSVQVHACHGRTRQVEVMRDAILHLLTDDPTLEPRDVVVMCPDIEAFAPLVTAVFDGAFSPGAAGRRDVGRDGLPDLRVRLADRAIRQTNPVFAVVAQLLELADGRVEASAVLDLATRPPVRRRFAFADDDLERLKSWIADAGIRWGLDAEHRGAFGLGGVAENTWRAGLDRLLLGVAMADEDDRRLDATVPLDDVEGSDVALAGRVAELVARLGGALDALRGPAAVAVWRDALLAAANALTATREQDRWQTLQLERILDEVVEEAKICDEPSTVALTLAEIRAVLDHRLRGRPTTANHRTGDLTVCTLVPMRSVPHRVVCLLGMDDGAFPRRLSGDGDDLVDADPCVGDRDARTEDRQLLLDALLAAGDAFVVTYGGRDERTNERRPPAVPIGELLDAVDRTVRARPDAGPARNQIVVEHPLQAHDARNFRPGTLGSGRPFSFAVGTLAGAVAKTRPRRSPDFLAQPLPALDAPVVALDDLVAFVEHPVKAFLRRRLGVTLPSPGERSSDAIPVELGPLDEWQIGDRLLTARLANTARNDWRAGARGRGRVPPGDLGDAKLDEIDVTVTALLDAVRGRVDPHAARRSIDVAVALRDGRSLSGTVAGVAGDVVLSVRYAKVKPKVRLAAWVRLLAAVAAEPDCPLTAVTIGRSTAGAKTVATACIRAPGTAAGQRQAWALDRLAELVDLYDRGMTEPLPLYCATSAAWAAAVRDGKDPETAARKAWVTERSYPNEDRAPEHLLVLGADVAFDEILAVQPCDGEDGDGWALDEASRFGRCARRLWDELLACEQVDDT